MVLPGPAVMNRSPDDFSAKLIKKSQLTPFAGKLADEGGVISLTAGALRQGT